MNKLILFTLTLSACAPIGSPPCATLPAPAPVEKPAHSAKAYFDCGREVECGAWCSKSEECREIEKEMGAYD